MSTSKSPRDADDDDNGVTHCSVCFNEYDLSDHVPRILPCHHSLCDACIKRMVARTPGHLQCPECRHKYRSTR